MSTLRRRMVSIPSMFLAAIVLLVLVPVWLPICVVVDLARVRLRFPVARLMLFGLGFTWLEVAGISAAGLHFVTGRSSKLSLAYGLEKWWVDKLIALLKVTTGLAIEVENVDQLSPGPVIMFCRHASLADSLVSAWAVTSKANMQPRYVLKQELINDPCLDIFGHRLPNYFVDRAAARAQGGLAEMEQLSRGMANNDVTIIFPEGTRASPKKRAAALRKVGQADPSRAEKLQALENLIPPRPAGAAALLAGAPNSDVIIAWHVGFDGLDTFGGILKAIARKPPPVRFQMKRVARSEVPTGDAFVAWLDETWLEADRSVSTLLKEQQR